MVPFLWDEMGLEIHCLAPDWFYRGSIPTRWSLHRNVDGGAWQLLLRIGVCPENRLILVTLRTSQASIFAVLSVLIVVGSRCWSSMQAVGGFDGAEADRKRRCWAAVNGSAAIINVVWAAVVAAHRPQASIPGAFRAERTSYFVRCWSRVGVICGSVLGWP